MREMGLALETSISSWVNAILLFFILKFKKHLTIDYILIKNTFKIIIALLIMIFSCYILNKIIFSYFTFNLPIKVTGLLLVIICSKIIYLTMIFMLKVFSINDLKGYLKK
jgi:putative peptidoglycan lipid II flippase